MRGDAYLPPRPLAGVPLLLGRRERRPCSFSAPPLAASTSPSVGHLEQVPTFRFLKRCFKLEEA